MKPGALTKRLLDMQTNNRFRSYPARIHATYLIEALESLTVRRMCAIGVSGASQAVAVLDQAPIASINGHKIDSLTHAEAFAMLDPFQDPSRDHRYTRNLGTRGIAALLRLNGFFDVWESDDFRTLYRIASTVARRTMRTPGDHA